MSEAILTDDYLSEIKGKIEEMLADLDKSPKNASAAKRVRAASKELEQMLKQYRKDSVTHHQKKKEAKKK